MTNNELDAQNIIQRGIGSRELRYGIMRYLRSTAGWPLLILGICVFAYGLMSSAAILVMADGTWEGITRETWVSSGLHALFVVLGLIMNILGCATITPYQFDTEMPGGESQRKCMHCGESLPTKTSFYCDRCNRFFPMDTKTYIGRTLSSCTTLINILIVASLVTLMVIK